jgi:adhesin/invasin
MRRRACLAAASLLLASFACTDSGTGPSSLLTRTPFSLRPYFSASPSTVAATRPIHRIRLTARELPSSVVIGTVTHPVDPAASQWRLPFDLRFTPGQQVVVLIEAINVTGDVESVEWSGRSAPITLTAGDATPLPVPLLPGPPDNLLITALTLGGAPSSLMEGDTARVNAVVVTSAPASRTRVIWSSSNVNVLTVDSAGVVRAMAPGEATLRVAAGAREDSARVRVVQRPHRIAVTPATAEVDFLGAEAAFSATVLDVRGAAITGHEFTWAVSDAAVATHAGGGRVRARATGAVTVTATSAGAPGLSGTATLTVRQRIARVEVSPATVLLDARGRTARLSARVLDSGGSEVPGVSVAWASSAAGVATVAADGTVTAVDDGTANVSATSGGVSASSSVQVRRVPARLEAVRGTGQTGRVGTPLSQALQVRASDALGHALRGAAVTFAPSEGAGAVSSGSATTGADGIADSGVWTLGPRAGTQTVTATVSGGSAGPVLFSATAEPGPPATVTIVSGHGQEGVAGGALPAALVVRVADSFDNAVPGVAVAFSTAAGSIAPASSVTNAEGHASATWTLPRAMGAHAAQASVAGAGSVSFTATARPGAPAVIEIVSGGGQRSTVTTSLPAPLVVRVTDALGNAVPAVAVSFSATGGTVAPSTSTTNSDGRASASWTMPQTAGVYTASASVAGVAAVNFGATASPGSAAAVSAVAGDGQTGVAGTALPTVLTVRVTDVFANAVPGVTVTFASSAGTVSHGTRVTDSGGRAATAWTLPFTPGAHTAQATVAGLTPVTFSATATPAPAASLTIHAGNAQSAAVGTAVAVAPAVLVLNAHNHPVVGATVTFAVTSGGGSITGATATSDSTGVAQVGSWTLGPAAGANTLTASVGALNVQFTATGTVAASATMVKHAGDGAGANAGDTLHVGPAVRIKTPLGAPIAGVTVNFAASGAGSSVTVASAVTDSSGIASAGQWILGPTVGSYTVVATAPSLSLGPLTFTATAAVGSAKLLTKVQGDGQTANAGSALSAQPQVLLTDAFGNPINAHNVSFIVTGGGGSVNNAASVTNASGVASAGVWTLGAAAGANTLLAQAVTAANDTLRQTFTATGVSAAPTVILSLPGRTFVGVSFSATLRVSLNVAAPAGGLTVNLSSSDASKLTLASSSVVIAAGDTAASVTVTGGSAGNSTVTGAATGYTTGSLPVAVSLRLISLPETLNVPFAGTASLPIQLAEPAPAGGTVVTITTTDASRVGLVSSTVTVPAGSLTANATLTGVYPGSATITASAVEYIGDSTFATTRASLNILETSRTFSVGFPTTATVRFESSGSAIAAPSGGVPVTFVSRNTACAVAPNVTIAGGLTSASLNIDYGGSATTPCSTYIVATASDIGSDSVHVTVNPPPGISLGATTVGTGLQRSRASASLGTSAHGGTTVRLVSSDPSRVLIAPNESTAGTDTIYVTIPNNQASIPFYVQGMDGVTGTAVVTASAQNFVNGTATITVAEPAVDLQGLPSTTTTLSGQNVLYAQVGVRCGTSICEYQARRAGGTPLVVTLTLPNLSVGRMVTASDTGQSATVLIQPTLYYSPTTVASGGAAFKPVTAGSTSVVASSPGFFQTSSATRSVSVSSPTISVSRTTVGAGLMRSRAGASLGASQHGGVTVRVESADSTKVLVSPDENTAGTRFIDVHVANGGASVWYYVHGLEGVVDSAAVTLSAPGFSTGSGMTVVVQPAIELAGVPGNTTSLSPAATIYAQIGVPNAGHTFMNEYQTIRAGASPKSVRFAVADSGVSYLTTSLLPVSDSVTAVIAPKLYYSPTSLNSGGVNLAPRAPGTTTVSVSAAGFVTLPSGTRTTTVTGPSISVSPTHVGAGPHRSRAGAFLGASQHGGVTVNIASADTTRILLSPDHLTPGTGSIQVFVANNQTSIPFHVQGVENATGTAAVTVSAPGFSSATATYTVSQPGLELVGVPSTTTTLSAENNLYVTTGIVNQSGFMTEYQSVRAGGSAITVTLTSSAPAAALVQNNVVSSTATVVIPAGSYFSPTSGSGGATLRPLTGGTTTISATAPGTLSGPPANRTVTVSAPGISIGATTVGAGLMRNRSSATLAASNHGGVNVRVRSSNGSVALVAANATATAADSIDVFVAAGQTNIPFYIHGVDGATGTVSITASASGFTDGSGTAAIVQPALEIANVPSTLNLASADQAVWVQVGIPCTNNTSLCEVQNRRTGRPALQPTITSSNGSVLTLVTSSGTGSTASPPIAPNFYYSPTSVSAGGVALRGVAVGSVTVSASLAGFLTMDNASRTLSVTGLAINLGSATVGAGLQRYRSNATLSGPNHGGVTVRLTSTDPSRLLVSPDFSTAGSAFIDVAVPQNSASFNYYAHGIDGTTGTVQVTAEIVGWPSSATNWLVVQPSVEVASLPSSAVAGGPTQHFYAYVGIPTPDLTGISEYQYVRAGNTPLQVTFTSSAPAVGAISINGVPGASGQAAIAPGVYYTPTSLASGGPGFVPLSAGLVSITASGTAFRPIVNSVRSVNVTN